MNIEADGRETTLRLPKDLAHKIRDVLDPDAAWEVL